MKTRWGILSALVAMVALSLAAAASGPQPVTPGDDPYIGASPITTEAPAERVPCQNYAYTCKREGGRCGPQGGHCYCAWDAGIGWICGGSLP